MCSHGAHLCHIGLWACDGYEIIAPDTVISRFTYRVIMTGTSYFRMLWVSLFKEKYYLLIRKGKWRGESPISHGQWIHIHWSQCSQQSAARLSVGSILLLDTHGENWRESAQFFCFLICRWLHHQLPVTNVEVLHLQEDLDRVYAWAAANNVIQ